jgi:uroporphyrinogen-III decarboxylase
MNRKQRLIEVLNGEGGLPVPAAAHWWGVYKFQLAGFMAETEDANPGWSLSGADLAAVDSLFYETFQPDLIHLSSGAWNHLPADDERSRARRELRPAVMALNSKQAIDDYIHATSLTEDEVLAAGIYDHVPLLVEKYGGEAMVMVNEGNPVCGVFENHGPVGDFQDALIATIEHPENLGYLIWKQYDALLDRMRALKRRGADGYIGSETCVSADILSPKVFRAVVFPALKHFYTEIDRLGLIPVTYFLGDINPLLGDIGAMGVKGLMVEESKKAFRLDVVDIRKRLDGRVALFGNVDSIYHLLHGTPDAVAAESRRQCAAAQYGPFILSNGSPVCLNTPRDNLLAMLESARTVN